ncbi:MAG: guanylate kinase, partial [Thermaurantiacus sp.]
VTTRPPRAGEVDGVDYHFVSEATFDELVAADHFIEHAIVFGNRYGSPKELVRSALEAGADVLFDVDWQGTRQLVENQFRRTDRNADVVSIFLLPPSMPELERRLRSRAADPEEVIRFRMNRSREEISHWAEYDYVLVNDNPDACLAEIRAILTAERLKRDRQRGLAGFVCQLLEK